MLDSRRQKDRKSSGQFDIKGNDEIRNKQHRNEVNTRIPNLIVGLAKANTRIPKKVNSRPSVPPVLSSSQSLCTTKTSDLASEILIRAQAKTLEAINKITNRVDKLEHRLDDIYRKVKLLDLSLSKSGGGIRKNESLSSGITPNTLSDESGDEFSRTTNGTGQDDDELLSLLNQITKFFDSVKHPQPNSTNERPTITRPEQYLHHPSPLHLPPLPLPPPHPHFHPLHQNRLVAPTESNSVTFGPTAHSPPSIAPSTSKRPISSSGIHHQESPRFSSSIRRNLFHSTDHSRQIDCPELTSSPQSFRALIFETNVENFLANLDFTPDPSRATGHYHPPSVPATLSPSIQRQHHQTKSHPIIGSRIATETLHHPHNKSDQR